MNCCLSNSRANFTLFSGLTIPVEPIRQEMIALTHANITAPETPDIPPFLSQRGAHRPAGIQERLPRFVVNDDSSIYCLVLKGRYSTS